MEIKVNFEEGDFTHGVIAIDPNIRDEEGNIEILHFVGYWVEPTEDDIIELWEDLKNNEKLGMQEYVDVIELRPAPTDIIEYFNLIVNSQGIEEDEISDN